MATKGIPFISPEDPRIPRSVRLKKSPERLQAWIDEENAKWTIVDTCTLCKPPHPLVAHEIEPHRLSHIKNTRARQIIGMIVHPKTTPETMAEVYKFLETM